jgi:putative membrane protein
MRIESHSQAARDRKKPPRFTFLPTAVLTLGALLFLAQSALAADEVTKATPAEEPFIRGEAAAGAAFVKVAELGAKKATDAAVRALSEKIVADLTVATAKLKTIASKMAVRLPDDPIAKYGDIHDQLVREGGADFDKAFLSGIITGHARTVKHFEEASLVITDSGLREWVVKTLPLFQAHLKRAKELSSPAKVNGTTGAAN